MQKYFKELEVKEWSGNTIIVDVDGTLLADGNSELDPLAVKKMHEMNLANSVFLFSNRWASGRDAELEKELQVPFLKSPFKKPNKKVIDGLPDRLKNNMVVIGDKILTDGLFAKNIKADFVKVKRLTSDKDSALVRLSYVIDNFAGRFIS